MTNILLQKNGKTICWRKLSLKDDEEVKRLVLDGYIDREPVAVALQKHFSSNSLIKLLLPMCTSSLEDGLCIGAYDVTNEGRLVAIQLATFQRPSEGQRDYSTYFSEDILSDTVFLHMSRMLEKANQGLSEHVGANNYMVVELSTVEVDYCRMGIMTGLRKKAETIANQCSIRYVTSLSASNYTQRIASILGYKLLNQIKFADYVDIVSGERPIRNAPPPHSTIKLMCKDLKS